MGKKRYYAIKKGQHPITKEPVENVVLDLPWSEVELYIKGVPGAVFKGFKTRKEAEVFLAGGAVDEVKAVNPDTLMCYVDGSFNKRIPNYGYGLVCVRQGEIVHMDYGLGKNGDAVEMFQIAGELLGAMKALVYAKKIGARHVVIYHDYEGVGKHATGDWKRKTHHSKVYHEWMQKFFRVNPDIRVEFQKVPAHSGVEFNEIADGLAKMAVGLEPEKNFDELLSKYGVRVEGGKAIPI